MKFYEVTVEAENLDGEWQGTGYWYVKPAIAHFGTFLLNVRDAIGNGISEHQLWHDKGLSVLIAVIDVPEGIVARYQRDAYRHDQADIRPELTWHLTHPRYSVNGEATHGKG